MMGLAGRLARHYSAREIGAEHVLATLLRSQDEVIRRVRRLCRDQILRHVLAIPDDLTELSGKDIPSSRQLKRIVDEAMTLAHEMKHKVIELHHFLVAFLADFAIRSTYGFVEQGIDASTVLEMIVEESGTHHRE